MLRHGVLHFSAADKLSWWISREIQDSARPKIRQTAKAKNQLQLPRPDGLGLSMMMEKAYLMIKKRNDDYDQQQTTLRNKLSKGWNWQSSAVKFRIDVLPLVPIDRNFQLCDWE